MNKYLSQYFRFKSAGDIFNVVNPIYKFEKEISESMAIRNAVKSKILKDKYKFNIVDLCAGNCLTGTLFAFTLPVSWVISVDKKPRNRKVNIRKWEYVQQDIFEDVEIPTNSIIVASHPCTKLATRIIDIYNNSYQALGLVLIPCCMGKIDKKYSVLMKNKLTKYELWSQFLADKCNGNCYRDNNVLSPANIIVKSWK